MDPETLKFAKSHEWVHIADGIATVGISKFAVKQLTDLVFVDLPQVGKMVDAGSMFGEVESVKAVSDLYAPVSGEVIEVNNTVADDLGILSDDPYEAGWLIKLKVADGASTEGLLNFAAYEEHCALEQG